MEQFKIPVLTPLACTIESHNQLQAYCQAVDYEVKAIFKDTYKSERTRFIEEQRRRQQLLLPTISMQQFTQPHQPVFTQANIQTRPTIAVSNLLQHSHNIGMTSRCHQRRKPDITATGNPNKIPTNKPSEQTQHPHTAKN